MKVLCRQPVLNQRIAVGMVAGINPKRITCPCHIGEQSLGICHYAADTTRMTRHNHRHRLASQFCSVLEEEGLHNSRHLAPPERSHDDDILIIIDTDSHGVDGWITACIVGIRLNGVQQLRTQGIVVRLIPKSFLCGLNLQLVSRNLTGQAVHYRLAVARVAVIHN